MGTRTKVREARVSEAVTSLGSLAEAAAKLGDLPRTTVKQWRAGEAEGRIDAMAILADHAGCSLDWLAGRTETAGNLREDFAGFLRDTIPTRANIRIREETMRQLLADPDNSLDSFAEHLARRAEDLERARLRADRQAEHVNFAELFADPKRAAIARKALEELALEQIMAAQRTPMELTSEQLARHRIPPSERKPPASGTTTQRKPTTKAKRKRGAK
jgi:hypothetical protein